MNRLRLTVDGDDEIHGPALTDHLIRTGVKRFELLRAPHVRGLVRDQDAIADRDLARPGLSFSHLSLLVSLGFLEALHGSLLDHGPCGLY